VKCLELKDMRRFSRITKMALIRFLTKTVR
jgi:hypothetical protein